MHPVDIAAALSEYGFLRMQDSRSVPRVYLANRVGTDSDSHALIKPSKLLAEAGKNVLAAIDARFDEIMSLEDKIDTLRSSVARTEGAGREINQRALAEAQEKLTKLTAKIAK
jgi:hypothetical protein